MQQVLTHDCEFEFRNRMPAEVNIHFKVAWDRSGQTIVVRDQLVHPTKSAVQFDVPRQVDGGSKEELLLGILCFVECVAEIESTRLDADVFLQQIIATAQSPSLGHLIVDTEFQAVCIAGEIVREVQGNDRTGREGQAPDSVVVVVERREGSGSLGSEPSPVAQLVGNQCFGSEAGIAPQGRSR